MSLRSHGHRILLGAVLVAPMALGQPAWAAPPAAAAATPPAVAPPAAAPHAADPPAPVDLKQVQERLSLETSVADLQLRKDLAALNAEKQRREVEAALAGQRLQAELASREAEIERLNKQAELLNKSVAVKEAERRVRTDADLAEVRVKLEKLHAENELAAAELAVRARAVAMNEQQIKLKTTEMQLRKVEYEAEIAKLNLAIELRDKRDQVQDRVLADVQYTKEPFKDGTLTISDRRIPLNGAITMATADRISERINFFNNQNHEYPIFIVIDQSPGGSVAAGYKILRTMQGSQAPVYVVVKSFAASMAAGITTLAARSFAYPNAIILHHQLSAGSAGNLTEQRERVKDLEEWWKRLATPVAAKMGLSLDDFIQRMYQKRSTGDWQEFADNAKKLHWVDEVANVIREESYVRNPDTNPNARAGSRGLGEAVDEGVDPQGHPFARLPRLSPVDAYYLYDPDHYYRLGP
jgi:ATP-dependent Clp protease protease subunit